MLDSILECRQRWDDQIAERMNAAARNGIPWVRARVSATADPATGDPAAPASSNGVTMLERLPLPPCYEVMPPWRAAPIRHTTASLTARRSTCRQDADLLAALCSLCSANHKGDAARFISWGQVGRLQLETPSLTALRVRFTELGPRHRQVTRRIGHRQFLAELHLQNDPFTVASTCGQLGLDDELR